jgi:uncharacterized membrane protein YccF (DUF307 family)
MVGMAMLPIMPRWLPSPVAVVVGPVGMAAIRCIAIAAVTIGRAVMPTAGKATAKRQQKQQHGNG